MTARTVLLCEPCTDLVTPCDNSILEAMELVPLSFGGVTNYICPRCGEIRGQTTADCSMWAHDE